MVRGPSQANSKPRIGRDLVRLLVLMHSLLFPPLVSILVASPLARAPEPSLRIVGGDETKACNFPSAAFIKEEQESRCTGTLVHPQIVTTAKHCVGGFMTFGFGEHGEFGRVTGVCKASPDNTDMAYCKLTKPVTKVPIVPILMGCELEALKAGVMVSLVGYGNSANKSEDGGVKRDVETPIHDAPGQSGARDDEILLGHAEKGSCNGDSGGPAYIDLRTVDGFKDKPGAGWRVFGVTSRKGPGGGNCASTSVYGIIAEMVPWIEEDSGIDITPCFDADGSWNPGPECKDFPEVQASGNWPSCQAKINRGASAVCGQAVKDSGGSDNPSQGTPGASDSSGSPNESSKGGGSGKGDNSSCNSVSDSRGLFGTLLLSVFLLLSGRRRRNRGLGSTAS